MTGGVKLLLLLSLVLPCTGNATEKMPTFRTIHELYKYFNELYKYFIFLCKPPKTSDVQEAFLLQRPPCNMPLI